MVVNFREPILTEYPNVEGSHAATVEVARECILRAIREMESAITHWREGEEDARVAVGERRYRAERIARLQMEFGLQWANVRMILEREE